MAPAESEGPAAPGQEGKRQAGFTAQQVQAVEKQEGNLSAATLLREAGYVALSRGRQENRLYVVSGLDGDLDYDEHTHALPLHLSR